MSTDPYEEDDVEGLFPGSTIKKPPEEEVLAGAGPWHLEVLGPPRTKKTSNEIHLTMHKTKVLEWLQRVIHSDNPTQRLLSKVKVQPSKLWRVWAKKAPIMMPGIDPRIFPIEGDLHLEATWYRERAIGDLVGYVQGLADLLEGRDIIVNDRQLVCLDGCRLDKDKDRPRVELTLSRGTDSQKELKL